MAAIFAGLFWWDKKRKALPRPKESIEKIFPHDRIADLTMVAAITGIIGAKIFAILEEPSGFLDDPIGTFFSGSGLAIYGGLICGFLGVVWYLRKHNIPIFHTLDALAANGIERSVNLKLLLDGEEERGSPSVGRIIDENRELFEADLFLFCDGPMHQSRRTQLVFGVRGSTTVDITSYGAVRPLHSGHYGNWAPNPIMQLSWLLTSLRAESGRILVDGYYDDVVPLGELERDAIAAMPDVTEMLQDELAVNTPEGEGKRLEELVTLPAINARGIVAGGVGEKGRNVILSTATTSLDLRLVPDQTPQRAIELIKAHLVGQGYHVVADDPSIETLRAHRKVVKLDWHDAGYPAMRTALDHPMSMRLTGLMRMIAPDLIVTPNMGGSLPLHEFSSRLAVPIIILPLANHDNNQHAENENIRLQNFWDAITVYAAVLASFGDTITP